MKKIFSFYFLCLAAALLLTSSVEAKNKVPPYNSADKPLSAKMNHQGARRLNKYQRTSLQSLLSGFVSVPDTLKLLAIQVQFSDSLMGGQEGSRRPEVRDSVFFEHEFKHLRDYYLGASRGRFTVEWDLVGHLYTLPNGMSYYGNDAEEEMRVVELAQAVIDSIDPAVDVSRYHSLFIIHAGAGQETDWFDDSRNQIWSSFYDLEDIQNAFVDSSVTGLATGDSLGGQRFFVDNFMIAPANAGQDITSIGSLGIWAFEVGSRIGLLPLFDSTPEGFYDSMGAGNFCLMAWGIYSALGFIPTFPCVFNRVLAGWVDPLMVEGGGRFRLRDINHPALDDTACLKIPINESEYFLVVNRVHDTNFDSLFTFVNLDTTPLTPDNADSLGGAEFDYFLTDQTNPPCIYKPDPNIGGMVRCFRLTGSGLYVWHIDENVIVHALQSGFLPNDFASRKGVDLEEADGIQDLDGLGFFSKGGYYDSFRKGHNHQFGPATDPSSVSNEGASTGITISEISEPGSFMYCTVSFSPPLSEVRTSWEASGMAQPATPVDIDLDGEQEVMMLAGGNRVYAFRSSGLEYFDRDGNPETIEPYLEAPGADWVGPGAFGDIDGATGAEIIALGRDGTLYAWKGDGSEVADGDNNPLTTAVLYLGSPGAAPPLLADIDGDGAKEVMLIEHVTDSLRVSFINAAGSRVLPDDPRFRSIWPAAIRAQYCAPPAYGACGNAGEDSEGVVIAWVDTVSSSLGLSYLPVRGNAITPVPSPMAVKRSGGFSLAAGQDSAGWQIAFPLAPDSLADSVIVLAPALGDLDADGFDEAVLVLPEGRLAIYDHSPGGAGGEGTLAFANLRAPGASAPSIGDVDRNGTMEIALWDSEYFYLYAFNGKLLTNWPQRRFPIDMEERPLAGRTTRPAAPVIGDINGDGLVEIIFTGQHGTVYGFSPSGAQLPSFPRPAPAGILTTPAVADLEGTGELSFVLAGNVALFKYQEPVTDSLITTDVMTLSLRTLPGSGAGDILFWHSHRNGPLRWGRAERAFERQNKPTVADGNTFIVYPNPAPGQEVNVRIVLNQAADVGVEIYNLEGEHALTREYSNQNSQNNPDYYFDERIDISRLSSGIYFLKLSIKNQSESAVFVKTLALRK